MYWLGGGITVRHWTGNQDTVGLTSCRVTKLTTVLSGYCLDRCLSADRSPFLYITKGSSISDVTLQEERGFTLV